MYKKQFNRDFVYLIDTEKLKTKTCLKPYLNKTQTNKKEMLQKKYYFLANDSIMSIAVRTDAPGCPKIDITSS